jgi:hypothetical protein
MRPASALSRIASGNPILNGNHALISIADVNPSEMGKGMRSPKMFGSGFCGLQANAALPYGIGPPLGGLREFSR